MSRISKEKFGEMMKTGDWTLHKFELRDVEVEQLTDDVNGENTGAGAARTEAAHRGGYSPNFDLATYFFHDVPADVVEQGEAHEREEADTIFGKPCRFQAWPDVPIRVIAGRDDRLFPIAFQRRVAKERLGVAIDELAGGHLIALSNPRGLVDQLLTYL